MDSSNQVLQSQSGPKSGPGRKLWLWSGAGVVSLCLFYSVFWIVVADRTEDALELWAEAQRQSGYEVRWDGLEISGYPFRVIVRLAQPRVSGAHFNGEHQWAWSAGALTLSGRPWSWRSFHMDAPGRHDLTIFHGDLSVKRRLALDFGELGFDAGFENNTWRHTDVAGRNLQISDKDRLVSSLSRFSGSLMRQNISNADERTKTGSLGFELHDLDVPVLRKNLIRVAGSTVRFASLDLDVYGPLPGALAAGPLSVWRDNGGVVEVRRVRAEYGPLALDAEGTLALDRELQPVGSFVAQLIGFLKAVDATLAAGLIKEADAKTIKLILGVLAKTDSATGESRLSIPVNIQDQTVHVGPLAVTKLPTVHW